MLAEAVAIISNATAQAPKIDNCKNVIEVNGIKYSFGPVIVLHKGESDVECLSESEICGEVIFLMDSEVTLCYDGQEFTAFELF